MDVDGMEKGVIPLPHLPPSLEENEGSMDVEALNMDDLGQREAAEPMVAMEEAALEVEDGLIVGVGSQYGGEIRRDGTRHG